MEIKWAYETCLDNSYQDSSTVDSSLLPSWYLISEGSRWSGSTKILWSFDRSSTDGSQIPCKMMSGLVVWPFQPRSGTRADCRNNSASSSLVNLWACLARTSVTWELLTEKPSAALGDCSQKLYKQSALPWRLCYQRLYCPQNLITTIK